MIVCKAFEPGLVCRGYRFHTGLNTTTEANCRQNGFHCAANPLDCLSYYGNMDRAEYWIVDAGGDVDEDEHDSKISCTELTILRRLSKKDFFLKDEAGNAWMRQTIRRISQEERAPGGLREKYLKALIDDMDRNGFEDCVVQWRDRILAEAFEPYCQKHNRWIGTPGNRWIYNDILRKYWLPDRSGTGGRWIGPDRSGQEWRFAPRIGPDPDAGAAA